MGLDVYLYKYEKVLAGEEMEGGEKIEIDSTTDPEHYFKLGYFRSSYNNSGMDRVLGNLGVPDLHDIFSPNGEYCFQPDWTAALLVCNRAIKQLQKKGNYRCFDISPNLFKKEECASEKEALDIFISEASQNKSSFNAYSNGKGHFYYKEPLKVLALISGTNNILQKGVPCTYVITEGENEWYLTALKIVKETIEYVLSQKDKEKYWLHWSG